MPQGYYPRPSLRERIQKYSEVQPTGCVHWTRFRDKNGYGLVQVDNRSRRVIRVVWELEHGPIPDGMIICHHCDDPPCINLDHLYLGTHSQNNADMVRRGRCARHKGESNPCAKVTEKIVLRIRAEAQHTPQKDLCKTYGLSPGTVSMIVNRKRWTHLPDEIADD